MTRLILIRHGQTDYNLHNKYCGINNPPLNITGVQQAKKLAHKLKNFKIDKIYSSDLKRAYQTAKIIFKNSSIKKTKKLREMNFGIFEGLKYEEIIKKHSKIYTRWIDNPQNIKIPKGESLNKLNKRVLKNLFCILSRHPEKTIAVVTHEGPIRIILNDMLKQNFWRIKQNNCALNIIEYPENMPPKIVTINDTPYSSLRKDNS